MCAPSAPAAPDYKGAAESTAQSQRVNQYTPYGSLIYSPVGTPGTPSAQSGQPQAQAQPQAQPQAAPPMTEYGSGGVAEGPVSGGGVFLPTQQSPSQPQPAAAPSSGEQQWQSVTTLNPEAQKALDSQMRVSSGLGAATEGQLGAVQERFATPMNLQSVQDIADKSYGAQTARLDPQWQQREDMERTRLANQGLSSGGEAYGNAMRDFGQQRNDAYQQANLAAIQTMPQTYQLESAAYNQPLNALNALRTGAQVQNPQFGGIGQPTNYGQAAQQAGQWQQGLFNADMGAYNSQLAGAATIGAAMISDRRLKKDIHQIGMHPIGVPLYEFRYLWDADTEQTRIGVMADELELALPQAVLTREDGYKMVRYDLLMVA